MDIVKITTIIGEITDPGNFERLKILYARIASVPIFLRTNAQG